MNSVNIRMAESRKIRIHVSNNNTCFVWNAKDATKIREEHRIIGSLIGSLPRAPFQDECRGLPLQLLPEEATLLREIGVAVLVKYSKLTNDKPSKEQEQFIKKIREDTYWEQARTAHEKRRQQIISMSDQIVEGKRKKLLQNDDLDAEEIIQAEIDKIPMLPRAHTAVQLFTGDIHLQEADEETLEWTFPSSPEEKVRYATFKHLWEEGLYLTDGLQFGGDFLAYPGEPLKFHAFHIVICLDYKETLHPQTLIRYGRLGSSTKKTTLLCTLTPDDTVSVKTLSWINVT